MGEQQLGQAWLYIPTGLKWKREKLNARDKPFPSLSHPLETAHCVTTDLLFKGSARLGIWSSGNGLRVLAKSEET